MTWATGPGVVVLPDGTRLRGRGRRRDDSAEAADWILLLLGRRPPDPGLPHRWLRWPDFWLPADRRDAQDALGEAYRRAGEGMRVEVACGGGLGRTGTALACIAQLGGVESGAAVGWVRAHYHPRAVETPWQRRYVARFGRDRDGRA